MNDRELLKLSAKACNIELHDSTDGTVKNRPILIYSVSSRVGGLPYSDEWNPLRMDSQAFRLAIRLKMEVDFDDVRVAVRTRQGIKVLEDAGGDLYAATRRAIVRAAAEIGKANG